jgi:hypothetical protein
VRRADVPILAPASQLPFRRAWRAHAALLPPGSVLIVAPRGDTRIMESLRRVAAAMRANGRRISTVDAHT